ncbi:MAG: hypothetical protein Ct9H300mP1_22490 [Planctomycetaceae bacterium]|nr:MAG: hypothetical protein Ct9H300mP1_22490 [Planctomycetaceae bacterium]
MLLARGVDSAEAAREFLSARLLDLHDPALLRESTRRPPGIVEAIAAERQITIYGITMSTAYRTSLLWHCLKLAGGRFITPPPTGSTTATD